MRVIVILPLFAALLGFASCNGNKSNVPQDTLETGSIAISVDETYRPVIEAQLHVFDSSYPNAHITASYKPESQCIKDFLESKARLILVTRDLSAEELKYCRSAGFSPNSLAVASDGVAVIVNPASKDSTLKAEELRDILAGKSTEKYTVVFDNEGSSILRHATDSILKGQPLGKNVFAAKSNPDVIDYVSKNKNAIGLVPQSFVTRPDDTASAGSFITNVRVMAFYNEVEGYVQPYQAYVAEKAYPYTRRLYFINRETWPGLGTGFANFLKEERGQLIFKNAHFFPLRTNIIIRSAQLNR